MVLDVVITNEVIRQPIIQSVKIGQAEYLVGLATFLSLFLNTFYCKVLIKH